jgi:hypothetical protein
MRINMTRMATLGSCCIYIAREVVKTHGGEIETRLGGNGVRCTPAAPRIMHETVHG